MRTLILIHRCLGIGIGILMAMWCLSGIVMMYAPYPQLHQQDRLAGLAPIDWNRAQVLIGRGFPADDVAVDRFELEMLAGSPMLRLILEDGRSSLLDLANGSEQSSIDSSRAIAVATAYASRHGLASTRVMTATVVDFDQWTVGGFHSDRPLFRVAVRDAAGTELYVSSRTGKLVQATTRSGRFLGWIGAVPHWLYPSILRKNAGLWTQVVVYTSLLGTLLTALGLVIGIRQLQWNTRNGGAKSPYRGVLLWHHVPGLIFGVLTLTWIASGMLSMNPWGLLEGGDITADRQRLVGPAPTFREVRQLLEAMRAHPLRPIRSIESASLGGKLFAVATFADASRARFDQSAAVRPMTRAEIEAAASSIAGAGSSWSIIRQPDQYHYSLMEQRAILPAIRIVAPDADYYYLDATSGRLIDEANAGGKAYRWWHSGLHRLDFSPVFRTQIFRSSLMLPLLLGATLVAVTGAFLGIRRVWPKRKVFGQPGSSSLGAARLIG